MWFVHNRPPGQEYTRSHAYRTSELNAITPLDILGWMNIKTFGIPDPPATGCKSRFRPIQFVEFLQKIDFVLHAY
jgi:hypothetical protein